MGDILFSRKISFPKIPEELDDNVKQYLRSLVVSVEEHNRKIFDTLSEVSNFSTVDIDGGTIDGVTIGGTTAPTVTDLGAVANCDINGGTIDGVNINNSAIGGSTPAAGAFTTLSATGLITATGGQIKFPATQSASADANTLDDYEEGTFTPGISFGNGTTGITYSAQTGYYTKIGNVVLFWIRVVLSNKGSSSGYARVTGLTFTASDPLYGGMSIGFSYNVTFANQMILNLPSNSTTATFYEMTESGGITNLTEGDFSNNSNLMLSGVYKTS